MYKPPPAFPLLVVEAPHVTHTRSEEPTTSSTHDGDALAVDVELASMRVAALPDASKNAGFPAHVPYMCPPAGAWATSGTTTGTGTGLYIMAGGEPGGYCGVPGSTTTGTAAVVLGGQYIGAGTPPTAIMPPVGSTVETTDAPLMGSGIVIGMETGA